MSIRLDFILPGKNNSFTVSIENVAARTRFGIEKGLWRSGKDIQKTFNQQVLSKDKTGRLYIIRRGRVRRRHRASAPGESPANLSGLYRRSFGFSVDRSDQLTVGVTAPYGEWLELGTKKKDGSVLMAARPGLLNAVESSERDIILNLSGGIQEEI